ncbi:hypothetical protein [Terrimonas pollutisoli]|uniref:hypothetical protein n=1 Tax=Terrimonas pollutisoli TaxID=3034147 RepID=UPI0023EC7DBD|nr:hypothetical protein [Terrimonas sp. H1YJ31]
MKIVLVTFFLLSNMVSISQVNRDAIFKSMDGLIKSNSAPIKNKEKKLDNLNGKVKFIIEDYYTLNGEKIERPGLKVPGNCYKYWYSKEGQLIRRQNYFDTVIYSDEFFLYKKGLLNQVILKTKSGRTDSINYTYNNNGFLIKEEKFYNGKTSRKKVFNYDNSGRLSQEFEFGDGFNSVARSDYRYSKNQLDSIIHLNGRTVFTYYLNGLLKQKTIGYPDNIFPTLYKYDNHSNIVEESLPTLKATYRFDYEYDKQLNWISKYDYSGGKLMSIIKRTIEYY